MSETVVDETVEEAAAEAVADEAPTDEAAPEEAAVEETVAEAASEDEAPTDDPPAEEEADAEPEFVPPEKDQFLIQPNGKPNCGAVFVREGDSVRPATQQEIDYASNYYAGFREVRKVAKGNLLK